jgi:hypothetical protein
LNFHKNKPSNPPKALINQKIPFRFKEQDAREKRQELKVSLKRRYSPPGRGGKALALTGWFIKKESKNYV